MFGGHETDLGVMMANELMLTLIVATSILAILTVIRHTRAEEENGSAELVLSSVVGRHARTAAAVIVMVAVNVVPAITMTAGMAASGFALVDTAAMCVGITAVAMVFGALAAVTAQLWRQARTATGAAMAALAAAVLVRGAGDVIDNPAACSVGSRRSRGPSRCAPSSRCVVAAGPVAGVGRGTDRAAAVLESRRQYDDAVLASSGEHPGRRPVGGVFGLQPVTHRG